MEDSPAVTDTYSSDPFAQHSFYTQINHSLVQRTLARLDAARPPGERVSVVEVASGTGVVTQLILDERERPATSTGIEPSSAALEIAREQLAGRAVQFVHTTGLLHWARPLQNPS